MKETVKKYKIEHLIHFTRVDNLPSIFKYGLLPVSELNKRNVNTIINGHLKPLDFLDGVSLSIGFPDYKAFHDLRKRDKSVKWAVILLDSSILWGKECVFFTNDIINYRLNDKFIDKNRGVKAFKRLFNDDLGISIRCFLDIPDNYPTNPKSHVLTLDVIEPKYIKSIEFEDCLPPDIFFNHPRDIDLEVNKRYFLPRFDYYIWR